MLGKYYFVINDSCVYKWPHKYLTCDVTIDQPQVYNLTKLSYRALIASDLVILVEDNKERYYKNRYKSRESNVDQDEFTLIKLSSVNLYLDK